MLSPKRTKYRKMQKGRIRGNETKSVKVKFGDFGLKALSSGRITARQIEASRRTITRKIKRQGKLWIRVFPDVPVTSKPTEVRMGKGKGSLDFWACRIKPGKLIFELSGVPVELAKQALLSAAAKLPIQAKFVEAEKK